MSIKFPRGFRKRLTRLVGADRAGLWMRVFAKGSTARSAAARPPRERRRRKHRPDHA